MIALISLLASSTNDTGGWGLVIIAAVVLAIVLSIAAMWTFVARRAGRVPRRARHEHEPGGR